MSQTTVIRDQREALHDVLVGIEGIKKVYYQPPSVEKIKYPCLIYEFETYQTYFGNNNRYLSVPRYQLTLIDYDVESPIHKQIMDLNGTQGCRISFNNFFTSDNLNHWVYDLYFIKNMW